MNKEQIILHLEDNYNDVLGWKSLADVFEEEGEIYISKTIRMFCIFRLFPFCSKYNRKEDLIKDWKWIGKYSPVHLDLHKSPVFLSSIKSDGSLISLLEKISEVLKEVINLLN